MTVERAAEVIQANGGWWNPEGAPGPRADRIAQALAEAGLLVTDEWVHVSGAGYTAGDMFEAFYAGIRWLADRVEIVDGEIDMPSEDHPGVIGMDHREACGSWLNDYDADTGRVNDDGEYRRPELVTDEMRAVLDAAVNWRKGTRGSEVRGLGGFHHPTEVSLSHAVDAYLAAGDDQ